MKPITKIALCLALLAPAACRMPPIGAAPTPTTTVTSTPLPTAIGTSVPTVTHPPPLPTETVDPVRALHPAGTPAAGWQGIPIMPGAIAGEDRGDTYVFTIRATPVEIQAYYERELPGLGWERLAVGQGSNGPAMLIFMKGTQTLTVSIIVSADECLVMIL